MSEQDSMEKKVTISSIDVPELPSSSHPAKEKDIQFLKDIPVTIAVELGRVQMPIEEILLLGPGSMIMLKRQVNEPIDLLVNGKLVGRGEIIAADESFGVRITEIIAPGKEEI
ncbi:MAG: flagellar motor switch protein FliN [Candidatus Brocadiae bacterium]|nr:flagellar motor switch protein FliN [Candidatus Brocadiia bacterium]